MQYRVIEPGLYALMRQGASGAKMGAKRYEAGELADWPEWYGRDLTARGWAVAGIEELDATEAARSMAEEYGISLWEIEGTGKDGRIVMNDVIQAVQERDLEMEVSE